MAILTWVNRYFRLFDVIKFGKFVIDNFRIDKLFHKEGLHAKPKNSFLKRKNDDATKKQKNFFFFEYFAF